MTDTRVVLLLRLRFGVWGKKKNWLQSDLLDWIYCGSSLRRFLIAKSKCVYNIDMNWKCWNRIDLGLEALEQCHIRRLVVNSSTPVGETHSVENLFGFEPGVQKQRVKQQ